MTHPVPDPLPVPSPGPDPAVRERLVTAVVAVFALSLLATPWVIGALR